MPKILDPGNTGMRISVGEDLGYVYPLGLPLKPGSKLHQKIVQEVTGRARDSQGVMRGRYESWKTVDQVCTAYVDEDLEFNQNLGDKEEINVIVPMGYATLDTVLSHLISLNTGDVFFKLMGLGPEDRKAAMLAELVLERQFQRAKMLLNFHTQYRDAYCYGLGIVSTQWRQQFGKKIRLRDTGGFSPVLGENIESGIKERYLERGIVWEGNELENWSPYGYLPDPNRPVQDVQRMHFVGNAYKSDYYELLEMERDDPETYFNIRYLQEYGVMESEFLEGGEWATGIRDASINETNVRIDVVNMYCKLIPKDWNLGNSEYPEIWLFSVAGDAVVIRAQPVTYAHNEYPVSVCSPTYDGYTTAPMSLLEAIIPLLQTLDWYFRSHFHNVRKTLNNMFLIDPYLVNYSHAATTEAGKLICMREHVWGRGVKDAMMQLQTTDVTRTHVADAAVTMDMLQRITGAVSQMQGVMETRGERRSATESRDTRLSALNRISKQAMIMSLQSNLSVGRQCLYNLQQFMDEPVWLELTGRHQMELSALYPESDGALVMPEDIVADVDVILQDPSGTGGEFLNEMIQMYQLTQGNMETMQAFDSVRMMLHMMRMSGTKNPSQFLRDNLRFQFMGNEEVLEQSAAGAIKPIGALQNGAPQNGGGGQTREESEAQGRAPSTNNVYSDILQGAINGF